MSKLRCKPGDLAVVVRVKHTPEMLGRIVIVERLIRPGEILENGFGIADDGETTWLIRSATDGQKLPNRRVNGVREYLWKRAGADSCLHPIRPNQDEDESLSWCLPLDAL